MYILQTRNFERLVLPIMVRVMMAPHVLVDVHLKGIDWAKLVAERKALNIGDLELRDCAKRARELQQVASG